MPDVLARVPESGRLLELGCGHGLFSNACALRSPALQVLGVDPSPSKIHAATGSLNGRGNVRFQEGRIETLHERGFDCVAILDVLYLVPRGEWAAFLSGCRDALREGGRLLLKEVDVRPRWKFHRCVLQETLSVRLFGLTLGGEFAFASREEMRAVLESSGFVGVAATDLGRGYLTPHVLYEATRP